MSRGIAFSPVGNSQKVLVRIGDVVPASTAGIRRGWFEAGRALQREASREILRRPKSGRTYFVRTRGGRRRRHVASAPGESHANLTGLTRRSIGWRVHGIDGMDFGYGASGRRTSEWGPFLEFGTRRMEPRPSLANAIAATQGELEIMFGWWIQQEMERLAKL